MNSSASLQDHSSDLVKEIAQSLQGAELIFIADVHLKGPGDEHSELLGSVLKGFLQSREESSKQGYVVLGGDIFDFLWGAKSGYFYQKAQFLQKALKPLTSQGLQVYYLQGNHEFSLKELSWPGVRMLGSEGGNVKLGSKVVGFSHGDLWGASLSYHVYRQVMHCALVRALVRLVLKVEVISRWGDRLAHFLSSLSRRRSGAYDLPHSKILLCGKEEVHKKGEDLHLFGHFHHPYVVEMTSEKKPIALASVALWKQKASVLTVRSQSQTPGFLLQRVELRKASDTSAQKKWCVQVVDLL